MEGTGVEWRGGEGRGGEGMAGQGRVPDCLGGLSRVGISSRSTRPWNGQPPSIYYRRVCESVCVCILLGVCIHVAACGPIGTKLGTRMEIHLEMVMGEIKITPCDIGGIWGGLGVRK